MKHPLGRRTLPALALTATASLALAAVFGARFVVNRWLYDADRIGWLVVAKITLGYPLTALGLVAVVWSIRRADRRLAHPPVTRQDWRSGP